MLIEPSSEGWDDIDRLWVTHTKVRPTVSISSSSASLYESRLGWKDLNLKGWWRSAVETHRSEAEELHETLQESKRIWKQSTSRFDDDPLATDWGSDKYHTGPLQIRQEENWSQWLASLLRSGPPQFLDSTLGFRSEGRTTVKREAHLPQLPGKDRYADILLFDSKEGASIEVKRNDTHYDKTLETASLIEKQYNREWTHFLLLPEDRMPALRSAFPERLEERSDGRAVIRDEGSSNVTILLWRDISEALRMALLDPETHDTHWEASAYIFCTLIEQKIANFLSEEALKSVLSGDDLIAGDLSTGITSHDVEGQKSYLQRIIGKQTDE